MTTRWTLAGAVLLVAGALLGACTQATAPYLAVVTTTSAVHLQAIVQGKLVILDDGCFGLSSATGSVLVAFPSGSRITDDRSGLSIPVLGRVDIGDHITGSGGFVPSSQAVGVQVPENCHADSIAIFNDF